MTERAADPIHAQIGEALDRYEKDALIAMMVHVIRTYVVEGTRQLKPELALIEPPKHLRQLNFPQLVAQLKAHLDLPELNLFSVVGNEVFVNLNGEQVSLTAGIARPLTPRERAAESPASPSRSMPDPSPPSSSSSPSAPRSGSDGPAFGGSKSPGSTDQGDEDNRFSMLDWD